MKNTACPHFPSKWQQRQFFGNRRNSTQASQQKCIFLETVKWAAELPHAKSTLLRASHHARRVQSQLCPSEAGMQQEASRFMGHTPQLSATPYTLESFKVCSYNIFLSANKLQWQLKVTSYWEQDSLLVFLCETSVKPGMSVCTYASGTMGSGPPSASFINWPDQNILTDSRSRKYSSSV